VEDSMRFLGCQEQSRDSWIVSVSSL
jgi:hypothetical protein